MVRIGALVGLAAEARVLGCTGAARSGRLVVGVTGARPERAEAEAERLAGLGVEALVSFGLAGGLDPRLKPGDLVIADRVITPNHPMITTDAGERRLWPSVSVEWTGAVADTGHIVETAAAKKRLFDTTGALAADMESRAIAEAAERRGLPVLILRAVADPAWRDLPRVALVPLSAEGRIRMVGVLRAMFANPREWPRVVALAAETRAALASLRQAASHFDRTRRELPEGLELM